MKYLFNAGPLTFFLGYIPVCKVPTNQTIIDDNQSIESGKQSEFNIAKIKKLMAANGLCFVLPVQLVQLLVLVLWYLDLVVINQ